MADPVARGAASEVVAEVLAIRGRRRGPIPRGNCPVCGREYALRTTGTPFTHRTIAANGYTRLGFCPGGE